MTRDQGSQNDQREEHSRHTDDHIHGATLLWVRAASSAEESSEPTHDPHRS
jgi:hypothetical protein